jgi:hypothetical protein
MAELELIDRERRMVERRIREARFPTVKSLDSFDFTAIPSLNKTLVLELARGEYIARRENAIAVGNTHIALGLGLAACQKGLSVGFPTAAALVHELIEAKDERRLLRLLAARLQALAEPNAVVIAAGTRRLVGDLFEYRDLGAAEVKGIAGPVPAWQVLRPSAVASRFEALRGAVLTRLVGRDEEINLLLHRWADARAGSGQVVLVLWLRRRSTGAVHTAALPLR